MIERSRMTTLVLRSAILWGVALAVAFYALLHSGLVEDELVLRYFAAHPVEYLTTTLFAVGIAALGIKALNLLGQFRHLDRVRLGATPAAGRVAHDCAALRARLEALPATYRRGYLWHRLRDAIEHVQRRGTVDMLDEELKYLADATAARAHGSYALVRIIVWAIPILGFLGTVVGITLAVAKLSPEALESSLPEVTSGLGVAFDTTALALALSMALMFAQFIVDRWETRLLAEVDQRAQQQLAVCFELSTGPGDPHVTAVRRMADAVVHTTERLIQRQADLWSSTIDAANDRWQTLAEAAGDQLQAALEAGLVRHAEHLAASADEAARRNQASWAGVQAALDESAAATRALQAELADQGQLLLQVVDATRQLTALEEALNRNLSSLAAGHQFEQTLHGLSAAIHLLNARLGELPAPHVGLRTGRQEGQAA